MPMDNPFAGYFEAQPEAGYYSYQNQWTSPNMKKYFQGQFGNIQNQYLGQLGQIVRGGQAPTLKIMDFLSQIPWQQQFQGLTPQEKGVDYSRFNPFSRWVL